MGATTRKMSRRRPSNSSFTIDESTESEIQRRNNLTYYNESDIEDDDEHDNNKSNSNSNLQYSPNPIIYSSEYQWQQRRRQRWRVRFRTGNISEDGIDEDVDEHGDQEGEKNCYEGETDNEGDHNVVDCETYYHNEEPDCDDENYNNHDFDSDSDDSDSTTFSHRSLEDNIPVETNIGRSRTGGESQSDSELETNSAHKRALHEASGSHSAHRSRPGGHKRIQRSSSSSSSSASSLLLAEITEDGCVNASSNIKNNNNNNNIVDQGETSTTRTIFSKFSRWRPSSLLLLAKTKKKPLFLLLVTCVSTMGVGLYTQSYTALSVALDQVAIHTKAQRKQATAYFDTIESDLYELQNQLLDLDPDASFLESLPEEVDGRLLREENDAEDIAIVQSGKPLGPSLGTNAEDEQENRLLNEMVAVKEKLQIETSQMNALEKYIQSTSFRDASRKYGTGVIRVQLDLDFPEDRNHNDGDGPMLVMSAPSTTLTMEMAPLELMPHSVYTFLEMVNAKLFDGCSFILNAMNVVKAAPLPYDGSSASQKVKAFTKVGLDSVSFREYSSDYPHEQFTVGFAADGSPSFYINTDDNTEQHVGEPCFARIVSGFGTIERLEEAPTRNGMWYRKRIGIKRARIL